MKIVRFCFAIILVVAVLVPSVQAGSGDHEEKVIHYVALGDSIAGGYGLKDAGTESYAGRIAGMLEQEYDAVCFTNFGKNGLRSEQLLDILTNEENEQYEVYREALRKADFITLSIGSNDLLQYLSVGMDFGKFQKQADEVFSDACEAFAANIPCIIDAIYSEAPGARLFVNNIYNPCGDISFPFSDTTVKHLQSVAETYIERMNQGFVSERVKSVFNSENKGQNYTLIDVKSVFEHAEDPLINVGFSWGNIDLHPNKEGHRLIADEIISRILPDQ